MADTNLKVLKLEGRIERWESFGHIRTAFPILNDYPDELLSGFDNVEGMEVPAGTPIEIIVIGTEVPAGECGMGAKCYGVKLKADSPFRSYFDLERDDAGVIPYMRSDYRRQIPKASRLLQED